MPFSLDKPERVRPVDSTSRRDRRTRPALAQLAGRQPSAGLICNPRPGYVAPVVRSDNTEKPAASASQNGETEDTSNEVIRQQLSRMLQSRTFVQSDKLSRFLRFVVEHVIDNEPGCLKEYVIGVEVYDRKPPYHPSQDSIVRTEARRLRGKLKEYYEGEGKDDPVYVYLRPGSYIPVFQHKKDLIGSRPLSLPETILPDNSSSVAIAVLPFTDVSGNLLSAAFARGIPDELAYALMLTQGCTVVSHAAVACQYSQQQDFACCMRKVGARIAYEGTVRTQGTRLRVTARIIDATGLQLWVNRLDADTTSETSFALEEQIAAALTAGFHLLFGQQGFSN